MTSQTKLNAIFLLAIACQGIISILLFIMVVSQVNTNDDLTKRMDKLEEKSE